MDDDRTVVDLSCFLKCADEIRDAYNIPEAGGSDQTIAIIGLGDNPNAESDLKAYRTEFDMPPCTEANERTPESPRSSSCMMRP